jgi:hypothetical protein
MSRFAVPAVLFITLALMPGVRSQPLSADEEQLVAIGKQWSDAEVKHDESVLNRVLDDDFVMVSGSGKITVGKAAFIEGIRKSTFTSMNTMYDRILINGDTAIVIGSFTVRLASGLDTQPSRYTVTYLKRQGAWRAIAEQIGSITAPK